MASDTVNCTTGVGLNRLDLRPELSVLAIDTECDAAAALGGLLGFAVPDCGKTLAVGGAVLLGLGPTEWLAIGSPRDTDHIAAAIGGSGSDALIMTIDITDSCGAMILSGPSAREALAAHCPLDLGDRTFAIGSVARSLLGTVGVVIARHDSVPGETAWLLIFDQTSVDHARRLLAG